MLVENGAEVAAGVLRYEPRVLHLFRPSRNVSNGRLAEGGDGRDFILDVGRGALALLPQLLVVVVRLGEFLVGSSRRMEGPGVIPGGEQPSNVRALCSALSLAVDWSECRVCPGVDLLFIKDGYGWMVCGSLRREVVADKGVDARSERTDLPCGVPRFPGRASFFASSTSRSVCDLLLFLSAFSLLENFSITCPVLILLKFLLHFFLPRVALLA